MQDISTEPPRKAIDGTNVATIINAEHGKCRATAQQALIHAMEAGRLLTSVKDQTPHGQWLPWLQEHCPEISERTAQLYMKLHASRDVLKSKNATVADLTIRSAAKLLAVAKAADTDLRFIPPPGNHAIAVGAPGEGFVQVTPAVEAGYFYVSCWRKDCVGNPGEIEGTKRPLLRPHAAKLAKKWAGDVEPSFSLDGISLAWGPSTAPWDFNRLLYASRDEWIKCGVLGLPGKGAA